MELNMRVGERWIPAQPGRDMKKVMGREAKISGKGKSADAKTSKNFQRFPSVRQRLHTTRALWPFQHLRLVIWCSIDPTFHNPLLFPPSHIPPLSLYHDELLFDEQVDEGIALSMSPISPTNLLLEHHTFILPPKHDVFCTQRR